MNRSTSSPSLRSSSIRTPSTDATCSRSHAATRGWRSRFRTFMTSRVSADPEAANALENASMTAPGFLRATIEWTSKLNMKTTSSSASPKSLRALPDPRSSGTMAGTTWTGRLVAFRKLDCTNLVATQISSTRFIWAMRFSGNVGSSQYQRPIAYVLRPGGRRTSSGITANSFTFNIHRSTACRRSSGNLVSKSGTRDSIERCAASDGSQAQIEPGLTQGDREPSGRLSQPGRGRPVPEHVQTSRLSRGDEDRGRAAGSVKDGSPGAVAGSTPSGLPSSDASRMAIRFSHRNLL